MSDTSRTNRPAWVDLSTTDPAAARSFYSQLLGWQIDVNPDPQYGGYGLAKVDGNDVAGIGPSMTPGAPPVWSLYIGTPDAAALGERVSSAGGTVVAPAFDVGEQGRMSVFQDPSGAFISAWQPAAMGGFATGLPNSFAWAELNARGFERNLAFYDSVFGWKPRTQPMGAGMTYTEFLADGDSIAGGMEMNPAAPPEMPSYWLVYFGVADVDASYARALELGAREMLSPQDFPGGRFAIVSDPQGAAFGLLKMAIAA